MCAKVLAGGGAYPVAGARREGEGPARGKSIQTKREVSSASSSGPDLQVSSPL